MIDCERAIKRLEIIKANINEAIWFGVGWGSMRDISVIDDAMELLKKQAEEIRELREVLTEMSMNGGTGKIQHDVCKYLLNLMDVIEERQMGKDCATD